MSTTCQVFLFRYQLSKGSRCDTLDLSTFLPIPGMPLFGLGGVHRVERLQVLPTIVAFCVPGSFETVSGMTGHTVRRGR